MKNFLIIVFSMFILVAGLLMCDGRLITNLKGGYDSSKIGIASDVVYASENLGFILEEKSINSILYKKSDTVIGEVVWVNGGKNVLNELCDRLGLLITKKYTVGNKYMIEGVCSKLKYFIEGRRENIQISTSDDGVIVVGSPIIYGSY